MPMKNQEVALEKLLKQLSRPLHFFLINVLVEAPQILAPSFRESIDLWLDAQPLLKLPAIDERKEEEEKYAYPRASQILSPDVLGLFHFSQVAQPSYQPSVPKLLRLLLPESKEENVLSNSIKISQLSFEMANLLFLLIQHGQFLLIIYHWYPFLQSSLNQHDNFKKSFFVDHLNVSSAIHVERNYMSLMAEILWYRSVFWILIYSIAFAYYIKIICAKNYSIRSLVRFVTSNEKIKDFKYKIKSILLVQSSEITSKEAKENYLFISYVLSFVSNNVKAKQGDWLSWFDDMSDFVLQNKEKMTFKSLDHLNRIYDIGHIFQSRLHYWAAQYLAQGVVKIGLVTLIIQTILSPKNYILDFARSASSSQFSYGMLSWIYRQSGLINWQCSQLNCDSSLIRSDSCYFSDISWVTPFLYFIELKLWVWFLIPLVAGIIEIGIIKKTTDNYVHLNKENFRKNIIDTLKIMQNDYFLMCKTREVGDLISPAKKAKKIHLIDNIVTAIHLNLQKPFFLSGGIGQRFFQVPNLLQNTLYQIACMTCKFLKLAYAVSATIALFMMIFIIENSPKNHCRRMHNAVNVWKKNQLESKISSAGASFFAPKQVKKETKALIFKPAFRYRAPAY